MKTPILWRQNSERYSTWTALEIGSGVCPWCSQKCCSVQHNMRRNVEFPLTIWKFIYKGKIVCIKRNEHNTFSVFIKCINLTLPGWKMLIVKYLITFSNFRCNLMKIQDFFFISNFLAQTDLLVPCEFKIKTNHCS